jgi:hypothetical protein
MASVDQAANLELGPGAEPSSDARSATALASGQTLSLDDAAGLQPLGAGWDSEAVVLDWNGRGQPDLLVTGAGGPHGRAARVHQRLDATEALPARYDEGTVIEGLEGLRCLCPIPNASASRFDLIALAPEGLVWLKNEGEADAPRFGGIREPLGIPADLGVGPGRVAQIVSDDWDGDGLIDLVIGYDAMEDYWPADLAALPAGQRGGFNQRGGHPGYDHQGNWRGRPPRGRLYWMRNVGEPGAPRFEAPESIDAEGGRIERAPHPAPLAIAWGGGRAVEFLLTDATGAVRLHRNFGGQRPPVLLEPRPIRVAGQPLHLTPDRTTVQAVDLDGDGRAELIYGCADGRVFAVHAGKGRDEATAPEPLLQEGRTLRFGGHAVVTVADLDADGDLDLIAGDGPGRLWLAEDLGGAGDHRYAAPLELDAGGLPFRLDPGPDGILEGPVAPPLGYAAPTIADWDGNGRPDLIVSGAGGEVLFFHHNGGRTQPRFDRPIPLRCDGGPLILPPRVRPAAADWRGTGELDLIGLDLQGVLCLYARTGPNEVAAPQPLTDSLGRWLRLDGSFGQSGRCAIWAGPWTGPGTLDLLVGLPRGNRHVVPALTGLPLVRAEELPTVLLLERGERGALIPRPLFLSSGRPLIVGMDGCSPCGADWSGDGSLDLLVGSDDGRVVYFRRDDLTW